MSNIMRRHYFINKKVVLRALAEGYTILQAYDMAICEDSRNDWHYSHVGYVGDVWEFGCSYYINRGEVIRKCISSAYADAINLGERTEIKQACGELPTEGGKWLFVVYCPEVDFSVDPREQGAVFTRDEWAEFLGGYDGRGQFLKWDSQRGKGHIQSFRSAGRPKASVPIRKYIDRVCESMPTLGEWLSE